VLGNLAAGITDVVTKIVRGLLFVGFHPDVLIVLSAAAAITAADRQWGLTGALWTFSIVAFLLAAAKVSKP